MTTAMTRRESRAMRKHSPGAARLRLAPRGQHWLVCMQQGTHPFCVGWAACLSRQLQTPSRHSGTSVPQLCRTQMQASTGSLMEACLCTMQQAHGICWHVCCPTETS